VEYVASFNKQYSIQSEPSESLRRLLVDVSMLPVHENRAARPGTEHEESVFEFGASVCEIVVLLRSRRSQVYSSCIVHWLIPHPPRPQAIRIALTDVLLRWQNYCTRSSGAAKNLYRSGSLLLVALAKRSSDCANDDAMSYLVDNAQGKFTFCPTGIRHCI